MKLNKIKPFSVKCITLGFEMACARHVEEFKDFFKVPIIDIYGTSEFGVLFMECEHGKIHHFPYKSFIETVDKNGRPTTQVGELIVTSFKNKYMPLIRYKTGDLVKIHTYNKCQCGFSGKSIERFEGRLGEATYTTDKNLITPRQIDCVTCEISKILFYQLEQKSSDAYILRYVSEEKLSEREKSSLILSLQELYGNNSIISLQEVRNISVSPSGKYVIAFTNGNFET